MTQTKLIDARRFGLRRNGNRLILWCESNHARLLRAVEVVGQPTAVERRCDTCKRKTAHLIVTYSGIEGALRCRICRRAFIPLAAWKAATGR